MTAAPPRLRDQQRASSEAAILDAAWALYADAGPDGVSLREVARSAGCTHALVVRYFGSKGGLVAAVGDRLTERVARTVEQVASSDVDVMFGLLRAARADRPATRLLVRSALGDLQPHGFPDCLEPEHLLPTALPSEPSGDRVADRRARLCVYGASSLLLGWITFEGFLVPATRLGRVGERGRDLAIAAAAAYLVGLAASDEPTLEARDLSRGATAGPGPADSTRPARDALLESAIELFAEHGPASVSVRDVARRAGVNHGLVHRHFGSKDALLAQAIEQGSSGLMPAALAAEGFDIDTVVHLLHHGSPAPRLIARTLVDDVEITAVRRRYPLMRRLLDDFRPVPTGSSPGDLTDPRVAVAAVGALAAGSAVWGEHLRAAVGLDDWRGTESAVADLCRVLLALPVQARPRPGGPG